MEKMYPAGSFTIMGQASLMEMQQTTLCLAFLKPFKSQISHTCNHMSNKCRLTPELLQSACPYQQLLQSDAPRDQH